MTTKRGRLNLVLALLFAALAIGAWFSREADEPGPPITTLSPEAVTTVEIAHPGADPIRLEKRGVDWWLVAPVEVPADPLEVGAVTGLADREQQRAVETAQADLVELGLATPKFTVRLDDTAIDFGIVESLEYRRYVKVIDAVSLIDDPPSAALDADYADLATKDVLPEGATITKIALPELTLSREADGPWMLSPADPDASADQLQSLANSWSDARAMWNEQADDDAPEGQAIEVTLADSATARFHVIAREPQLKLRRDATAIVHVLSKALADTMLRVPDPPAEPEDETDTADDPAGRAEPKASAE